MTEVIVKESGIENIELFGDVDKVNGKVGSEYPAWYFKQQTQDIREEIRRAEHALENGLIPEKGKPVALADLKRAKEKLNKIEGSRPNISDVEKDELGKLTKDLGKKIGESMFSRSDEAKGVVDPAEEMERQQTPCIKVNSQQAALAHKMGCRISRDGEISRNDAARMWKISQGLIGGPTNTETLRRG